MRLAKTQAGVTLIEVLTAILVIGLGLTNVAGLSLANLKTTVTGQIESQATILADEIADTMRANLTAYQGSEFSSSPESTTKVCSSGTVCTATEQAQYDAQKWLDKIATALPGGVAAICMDSTPLDGQPGSLACDGEGLNTVKIFWTDNRGEQLLAEGETFQRYSLSITP